MGMPAKSSDLILDECCVPKHDLHFRRVPELLDAEFLCADYENKKYYPHSHDTVCFALITGGELVVGIDKKHHLARKGDIVLINANEIHSGISGKMGYWCISSMHLTPAALDDFLWSETGTTWNDFKFRKPVINDKKLSDLFMRISSLSRNAETQDECKSLIPDFLSYSVINHCEPNSYPHVAAYVPEKVAQAKHILRSNLSKNITLTELADALETPMFGLMRLFSKTVGLTPHAWHLQMRIKRAASLLRAGDELAGVAYDCGFSDQAHLTRTFSRMYGITPGKYRSR